MYDSAEDDRPRVYCTAYTDEQVREGIIACAKRHGRNRNVRSRDARDHMRENPVQ